MTSKSILRHRIKELKAQLSPQEKLRQAELVRLRIEAMPEFQAATNVMLYHSLSDELPTLTMIDYWQNSKRLFLPALVNGKIHVRRIGTEYQKGVFGICEPRGEEATDELQIIIVPGIAFDSHCNRMGRGKGYYDNFLCTQKAFTVGVALDCQIVEELPTEPHDVKMHAVVTANDTLFPSHQNS